MISSLCSGPRNTRSPAGLHPSPTVRAVKIVDLATGRTIRLSEAVFPVSKDGASMSRRRRRRRPAERTREGAPRPVPRPDRRFYAADSGLRPLRHPLVRSADHADGALPRPHRAQLADRRQHGLRLRRPAGDGAVGPARSCSGPAFRTRPSALDTGPAGDSRQCNVYLPLDSFLHMPKLGRLTETMMGGGVIALLARHDRRGHAPPLVPGLPARRCRAHRYPQGRDRASCCGAPRSPAGTSSCRPGSRPSTPAHARGDAAALRRRHAAAHPREPVDAAERGRRRRRSSGFTPTTRSTSSPR